MTPRARIAPCATLVCLLCGDVFAAAPRATVYAGLEVGEGRSNRVDAGATLRVRDDWTLAAALARAEVEFPDARTNSTLAVVKGGYDFGAFGVGAGYRQADIGDVSTSRGWLVNADFVRRELRFAAEIEARQTTLEPAAFVADLGGTLGTVSGVGHCSVDGMGYQGRVDWDRPTWSVFVSWRVFDYDDYDCALDIEDAGPPANGPGGPAPGGPGNGQGHGPPPHAHARDQALRRRLAAASTDEVIGAASRLVPREAALLDSSAAMGFTMPVSAEWIGGAELYRDVERIDGSDTLTGLVFAGRRLSDIWRLELSVGYSRADVIDDTAFAGVRVSAAL